MSPIASRVIRFGTARLTSGVAHGGHGNLLVERALAGDNGRPLRFVDIVEMPPLATVGSHTHGNDEELYIIISGRARVELDGAEHMLEPGDVAVNRPGGRHALYVVGEEPVRMVVVCVAASGQSERRD